MDAKVKPGEWERFCDTLDVGALVPEVYARYRGLVRDGLWFFLDRLPARRRRVILIEQQRTSPRCGLAERVVALMQSCPTLHKLGQVVARDRRLTPAFRRALRGLESMRPTINMALMRSIVDRELGDLASSGARLGDEGLAEASVAVVVPFVWQEGIGPERRDGVFKVLKPGVEERLGEELAILGELGGFLDEYCARNGLAAFDYRRTLEHVRELLGGEVRLDREQVHLKAAAECYDGFDLVRVPRLLPFCTSRVTAMERIDGRKVTDDDRAPRIDRRRLAELVVEALVAHPAWSGSASAMFHADPHAGNLLVTDAGELAILDWSLVGHLGKQERIGMTRIVLGAATLDALGVARAVAALAHGQPDESGLSQVVDDALRRVRRGVAPGLGWLVGLLDDAAGRAAVRFGPDLMMFRKAVLTLEGVVADISEDCSTDAVVTAAGLDRFLQGWMGRLSASPFSHDVAAHVSNAELMSLLWSWPVTATRLWMGTWGDWADAMGAIGTSARD